MDKTNGLPVQNGIDTDVKDFRYVHHQLIINQCHTFLKDLSCSGNSSEKPLLAH